MDYRRMVQASMNYIEDNLTASISAKELAAQAGFSLYHFCRMFRLMTGFPVMRYVLRRRLLHAAYAMGRGRSGIDAALTYGFDTYAGFYRAFVREYDCTPAAFLRLHRAKRPYRPNIYKEAYMAVTRESAAALLKHWYMEGRPVREVYCEDTGHQKAHCFDVDGKYILKYTDRPARIENQRILAQALASAGLTAAVPLPAAGGLPYVQESDMYFSLTPRIPGHPLSVSGLFTDGGEDRAGLVGEILGRLHGALAAIDEHSLCLNDADLLATVRDWALPKAGALLGIDADFQQEFMARFGALYPALPRQIIHRDPNPGNILLDGDQWAFIDFELSEKNARLYDPCYAASAILSEHFPSGAQAWPALARSLLRGYDRVARLTAEEKACVPCMLLANQLVCVAWFAGQEKYADCFEINRRMTLLLMDLVKRGDFGESIFR